MGGGGGRRGGRWEEREELRQRASSHLSWTRAPCPPSGRHVPQPPHAPSRGSSSKTHPRPPPSLFLSLSFLYASTHVGTAARRCLAGAAAGGGAARNASRESPLPRVVVVGEARRRCPSESSQTCIGRVCHSSGRCDQFLDPAASQSNQASPRVYIQYQPHPARIRSGPAAACSTPHISRSPPTYSGCASHSSEARAQTGLAGRGGGGPLGIGAGGAHRPEG